MKACNKQRIWLLIFMAFAFLVGLAVTPTLYFITRTASISKATSLENAFATQRLQLSGKVWLLATGGTGVMLADEQGLGLVYGNVIMAGHPHGDEETLLVLYLPHEQDQTAGDDLLDTLVAAKIDLISGNVLDKYTITHQETMALTNVFDFMNGR